MNSVAFKWRVTNEEHIYLTSMSYNHNNPDYSLGGVSKTLTNEEEDVIADIVRKMNRVDYERCFSNILPLARNYNLNLRNWEYYYNMSNEGCTDCEKEVPFYTGATASAQISVDGSVNASVKLEEGILNFSFLIPKGDSGEDGEPGKDGLDGIPGKDGAAMEFIYQRTTKNESNVLTDPNKFYGTLTANTEGLLFNEDGFIPDGWSDRPEGITEIYKYEWVSTRKREGNGLWGKFSEPKLMSRWGEDGKDGDGIEYIYKLTNSDEKPNDKLTPDDWETNQDYQNNEEYVDFIGNDWFDSPQDITNFKRYEWIAFRKQNNGTWGSFSEPKLWARWGEDGDGIENIYCITNSNDAPPTPSLDEEGYQDEEFYSGIWSDEYVEPTYMERYAWVSTRKSNNGVWGEFSEPKLWNTYKVNGRVFVDLYTRSNTQLDENSLPNNENIIYYSFNEDKFYKTISKGDEITSITHNNVIWYTDIPEDTTSKFLYKTSASVLLNEDLNTLVEVLCDKWMGPYLIAINGENSIVDAPSIVLNDDSLSIPIIKETFKPHNEYEYNFEASLYNRGEKVSLTDITLSVSDSNKLEILEYNPNIVEDEVVAYNVKFKIKRDVAFNTIETISITLKGNVNDNIIEANSHFKVIPYPSEESYIYKIRPNCNTIYIPSNVCELDENGNVWHHQLTATVVKTNDGSNIELNENNKIYYLDKVGKEQDLENGITLFACGDIENKPDTWVNINELSNPLTIIFKMGDDVRDVEYIDFVNIPKNGIDGKSSRLVFAYTSTKENEKPNTPIGGGVNFDDNTITYPYDESNKHIWGGTNELNGVIWLSQCEFFSDGTRDLSWTTPIRLTGFKGDTSYHIELTNDMDQIYVIDGKPAVTGQTVETTINLINGTNFIELKEGTVTASSTHFDCNVKVENGSAILNATLKENIEDLTNDKNLDIVIEVEINENEKIAKLFKIKKLVGVIDFDLHVSPTTIRRYSTGFLSTNHLTINTLKREISTINPNVYTIGEEEFGIYDLSIKCHFLKNGKKLRTTETFFGTLPIPQIIDFDTIVVELKKGQEVIDSVNVDFLEDGQNGQDGSNGKTLYPAGEWKETTPYKATATATPFVSYKGEYYVLIVDNEITGIIPTDTSKWMKMEQYEAIYTKLLVAENGLIGESVYNGDYVFSKTGRLVSNNIIITNSTDYINFDSNIVDSIFSGGTVSSFTPNYLVDFKEGRAWFGNGKTTIEKTGVIHTKDLVETIEDFALPYPSSENEIKWNKVKEVTSGLTKTTYYVKNISAFNSYLYDDNFSNCPPDPMVIHIYFPNSVITRANVYYKGTIYLGNTCASAKYICFPGQNIKYNGITYSGTTNGIHVIGYNASGNKSLTNKIEFIAKWDGVSTVKIHKANDTFSTVIKVLDIELIGNYELKVVPDLLGIN